jgi:formate hydrogenlyase subunit 6/NADH:ubiquinone oxidoreductase subunit I
MIKPGKMAREVLQSLFRAPATVPYPSVKAPRPDRFRGKIEFTASLCIGCKLCMRDCPANALTITKVGDKRFQAEFDLAKCIFCAQCAETCPRNALHATAEYELAQLQRDKLKVIFHAEPASPSTPATPAGHAAESGPAPRT